MSNQLKNPTPSEHCWNIFFQHYSPGQAALIEPCMNKASPQLTTGIDWDLPAFYEKYEPRLVILLGIGSIEYLLKLSKSDVIKQKVRQFIIVEDDPEVVTHLINDERFLPFITSMNFRFIFLTGKDGLKPTLFSILKQPEYSRVMQCAQLFVNEFAKPQYLEVYEHFTKIYDETVFHVFHNYGRIDDSIEGISATLKNHNYLRDCPGIQDLKDTAVGRTVALVGAGPTLDEALPVLAEHKDKLIIIAADAAVKPLLRAGITPQFTTSIERGNIYQKPFWENLPPINTELVFFPVVHPEVLSIYTGPKRVVYRNYSYYAYFQNSWPKGILASGGSTSHLANRLAAYMGAEKIIFVGIDSSYEKNEQGLYRSHANGVGYEDWASWKPISDFGKSAAHASPFEVEANDGSAVMTNVVYNQWAKEFSEEVMSLGTIGRTFTCAKKGVRIPGVQLVDLGEFLREVPAPESPYEIPVSKPVSFRDWDHKHLVSSLKGWKKLATDLLLLAGEVESDVTPEAVASIYQFLEVKFLEDDMFVSFVIQNCAAEFYQLQNRWQALPNTLVERMPEKLDVLKAFCELYKIVLDKLLAAFEEVENNNGK